MKYYHITQKKYVGNILEQGLLRGAGKTARFYGEEIDNSRIYLTTDWECLLSVDSSFSEYELALFEIIIPPSIVIHEDTAYDLGLPQEEILELGIETMAFYVESDITKDNINYIGELVRKGWGNYEIQR